jgi:hypothetical protein
VIATERIGGLAVCTTHPLFLTILAIHVFAAVVAVVTGAIVAARRDKKAAVATSRSAARTSAPWSRPQ